MSADLYSDKEHRYFGSARPEMLRYVPTGVSEVLEVGCGRGGFSAALKKARHTRVTAIEPFVAAATIAATQIDEVLVANADEGLKRLQGRLFDCIVFNDVLEHLVDPESTLIAAATLLRPGGLIVASIPNIRFLPVMRGLVLRGEWRYTDEGVLDRTHLRFYTVKSIAEMFAACGYQVRNLEGINPCQVSWKFRLLNRLTSNAIDDMRYLQFAVVASRDAEPASSSRATPRATA